jgi:hypothetical protein
MAYVAGLRDNSVRPAPFNDPQPTGVGPGYPVVQALEDDISLIWLKHHSDKLKDVTLLEASATTIGANGGEISYGRNLDLMFSDPTTPEGSRTPDIIVAPNVGVIYTGGKRSWRSMAASLTMTPRHNACGSSCAANQNCQQPGRDGPGAAHDLGVARSRSKPSYRRAAGRDPGLARDSVGAGPSLKRSHAKREWLQETPSNV